MKEVTLVLQPSIVEIDDPNISFDVTASFSNYRAVLTADDLKIRWTVRIIWPDPMVRVEGLMLSISPQDSSIFATADLTPTQVSQGEVTWSHHTEVSRHAHPGVDYPYSIIIKSSAMPGQHLHGIDPLLVVSG